MNSCHAKVLFALLAVLGPSLAMAASVTITPSTLNPDVGDTFTMTVTGDVPNTFAATMALSFNATTVEYVSGIALSPWNVFVKNSPTTANPTVFDVETPAATAANPGVYNVAELTFRAIASGAANIVINDDGGNVSGWFDADTADWIPVTYTQAFVVVPGGVPTPLIRVTDSTLPPDDQTVEFGQVTENTTSAPKTVTVTNIGTANLILGAVAMVDSVSAPFSLVTNDCDNASLAPGSSCTLTLDFSPVSTGDFPDTFDIPSNDGGTPTVTVTLNGTGIGAPTGDVAVTDSVPPINDQQIPFGNVSQNTVATATITVTNNGSANLTVGQVASLDGLVAPFSLGTDDCSNRVLAPAGACTVQVLFQPTALAPASDTLDIPSDDPDSPSVSVAVSGTGVVGGVGNISVTDPVPPNDDRQVSFGGVGVGLAGRKTITVTNQGNGDLVLGTVAAANPVAAPFSIGNNSCSGRTLAPGASCTLAVDFQPQAQQPFNDAFDIPSNDPDEPAVTVSISGSGVPAPRNSGSSAMDPATVLALGLLGLVARRRFRRAA